ncbi:hypothetical protein XELAEV_18044545mg [Xenopus laevis]|uniref:Uncharacterized protein n=1 Tax=Xenopus laevis TaxID=8355 RepID=A0A974BYS1_XENLA|nr:hypothetical protein XELAEV_18044545mg [Xenopus laevis]
MYCWIIGHSYVMWAAKRAAARIYGRQLGLSAQEVRIRWERGMGSDPKILVIRADGNDLCSFKNEYLVNNIKQNIAKCCACINGLIVVWSEVVSRTYWRGARNPKAIEKCRRKLIVSVSKFVERIGGILVRYRELEKDNKCMHTTKRLRHTEYGFSAVALGQ